MMNPEERFYNDLPQAEQAHWASLMKPCPAITQLQPVSYAAYLHHPVTYLVCEDDQGLPAFLQKQMVADVEKLNPGVKFKMESCDSGHFPFLSMPERVVKAVDRMLDA